MTRGSVGRSRVGSDAGPSAPVNSTRRAFGRQVCWSGIGLMGIATGLASAPATAAAADLRPPTSIPTALLEGSPFVYISPLHANGSESACHGELWYAWLDESVVVTVATDRWKASALARGLDRARIWVGDHGRWKTWYGGHNEAFKAAPHFDARAERVEGPEILERLLARYESKYPAEIGDWRERMREGGAEGTRIVMRYSPTDA